jgi:hypothetical protein
MAVESSLRMIEMTSDDFVVIRSPIASSTGPEFDPLLDRILLAMVLRFTL